jgi:8-oxo-dGTP pyrophosphatase MutT (NUDIX family)
MSFEALRRGLASRSRRDFDFGSVPPAHAPPGGFARAAVLVPLFEDGGTPHVLLTRRHPGLRHHPGQIAFPGGRLEPGEEASTAALREAEEEIGLPAGRAEILGRLDDTLVLASPFRLTPFVARVPYPYSYAAQQDEVDEILFVPLPALARPGAHRLEVREAYGMSHEVHVYDVGPVHVFGATARILTQLLGVWRSE